MKKLLNGMWILSGENKDGAAIEIEAAVPGYVMPELEKAGILPDLFYRDNNKNCHWTEDKTWVYTKKFTVPDVDLTNAYLSFDGVDTYADIILNGETVYKTSNMFLPFCVSGGLKKGENELKVVIRPYKEYVINPKERTSAFGMFDRLYVRRVQCTFFWDWVDRFVSAGICGDVSLVIPESGEIENAHAEVAYISDKSAGISLRLKTKRALENGCRFKININAPDGKLVWTDGGRVFLSEIFMQAGIRNPELWWPAGYGKQPLYTVSFTLFDKDGKEIDSCRKRIGIRTVAVEMLQDEPGSIEEEYSKDLSGEKEGHVGESLTVLVNGERIFAKGGNWVPPSPFPDRSEKYKEKAVALVKAAADANINMLRVWGGGVYEPDEFYDACDEYGILLTHDFMFACGDYPFELPEFCESVKKEIEANVLRLRHHACIAYWSADNENISNFAWDDPKTPNIGIMNDIYLPILERLDPGRVFRISNPYGGRTNDDYTVGENHGFGWWPGAETLTPDSFKRTGRFIAENPVGGYPPKSSLKKFLAEEDMTDYGGEVIEYHIKNNPHFTEVMHWPSIHGRLKKNADVMVGGSDELYRYQYIEYEWIRLLIENARLNKNYTSGVLFWMYNDCWPALGFAMIDYYLTPKSGLYAMKHTCSPIAAAIRKKDEKLCFSVLNDSLYEGGVEVKLLSADSEIGKVSELYSGTAELKKNKNTELDFVISSDIGDKTVIFADVYKDGKRVSRARYYSGWLADVKLAGPELKWSVGRGSICVECVSNIAIGVSFDGEFVLEDNFFDMLPGEKREIKFTACDGFDGMAECAVYQN